MHLHLHLHMSILICMMCCTLSAKELFMNKRNNASNRCVRFTDEEWEKVGNLAKSLDPSLSKAEFIRAMVLFGKINRDIKLVLTGKP